MQMVVASPGRWYLANGVPAPVEYASPIEAASLRGLPDAYIETAEFDCLRDEGLQYAEALGSAGCAVELYKTKGTMHGFDIAEDSGIVHACVARRIRSLRRAFGIPTP